MVVHELEKESHLRERTTFAQNECVALSLAQFMAQFADDVKLEGWFSSELGLKTGYGYPVEGDCGHRFGVVYVSSFLRKSEQIVGKQKGGDVASAAPGDLTGPDHPAYDVEDGIRAISLPINLFSLLEARDRRNHDELCAFLVRKEADSLRPR